jgi:hypothetical protein
MAVTTTVTCSRERQQITTIKAKAVPLHATKALGGEEYSSFSFSTSALDGGEWSALRPGRALPPGPIVQEAGWAPEPVWIQGLEEKSFRLCWGSNLDRSVVQPVARHYTDLPGSLRCCKRYRILLWVRQVTIITITLNCIVPHPLLLPL